MSAATTAIPRVPSAVTSDRRTWAASNTNNMPTSMTVSCSLNSRTPRVVSCATLVTSMPATITARIPESGESALLAWNVAHASVSVNTFSMPAGINRRERSSSTITPPPTAPASAPIPRRVTTFSAAARMPPECAANTASKATTAMMAPMASMNTPSASRMVCRLRRMRMRRSSGDTTVGPVTMTRAPNNTERRVSHPMNHFAASDAPIHVTTAPSVTRRRMVGASARSCFHSRFMPPSKRMTAIANPTMTCSPSPSEEGSTMRRPSGPRSTPKRSRMTMPGRRR